MTVFALAACTGREDPETDPDTEDVDTDAICLVEAVYPERPCCDDTVRVDLPDPDQALDLRTARDAITCATYEEYIGLAMPELRGDYPLRILLPAVDAADPACADVCPEGEPATAFGFAFDVPAELLGEFVLAVHVDAPWRVVSGGCGKSCPWPCLSGYQEFGVDDCLTIEYGSFGLATAELTGPAEAIVDLVPIDLSSDCCLFR